MFYFWIKMFYFGQVLIGQVDGLSEATQGISQGNVERLTQVPPPCQK